MATNCASGRFILKSRPRNGVVNKRVISSHYLIKVCPNEINESVFTAENMYVVVYTLINIILNQRVNLCGLLYVCVHGVEASTLAT